MAVEKEANGLRRAATLVLSNGREFKGWSFGAQKSVSGEAVFQTGMVGYPEALTDPSYCGQLLVLTYPLVGNYGVPADEVDELTELPKFFESNRIWASALIVCQQSEKYSHWNAVRSLSNWMAEQNVPGIEGIDTRELTKVIREEGTMLAKIVLEGDEEPELVDPNLRNLASEVSRTEVTPMARIKDRPDGCDLQIVVVDCGLKNNQLRCLLARGVAVTVVPWNADLVGMYSEKNFDGVFISNGPGDPEFCGETIANISTFMDQVSIPMFGICLGHQLLALAAGFRTYKLPYGNRGHNQPCVSELSRRCYMTSQNHGYAVDASAAACPKDWRPLFTNANDGTNEGIMHKHRPIFSVQFHPEAQAGPHDTEFLFDVFVESIATHKNGIKIESVAPLLEKHSGAKLQPPLAKATKPGKIVVLGSGGLSIGQAGEFDYSGSQAIKALKEEGIYTVLINPNIATVQTSRGLADKVYFLPVNVENVVKVLENERPDGILLTFGGQTALNCGTQLYHKGELQRLGVEVLGTPVESIMDTEDRERFNARLDEIGEPYARSQAVENLDDALVAAKAVGYPVIVRAAFALGGLGSGFADNEEELRPLVEKALTASPQVLVEKSMRGWKEVEYEVVRDAYDNCITVCNMENFDPLGVHTGDSIVIAPSQTLTDEEYNMLRDAAQRTVRMLGVVGECNIQFSLNPHSLQYCTIEVNARLSRSSALASKATGYPLAFVAAKLALRKSLTELHNSITKKTIACFEPSLDYLVVKMPRWDLKKFERVSRKLGSAMKSVGEVMAIGRTFQEAIQKAVRMVTDNYVSGFEPGIVDYSEEEMKCPTDERLLCIASGLKAGVSVDEMHELSKIDKWFLYKLEEISRFGDHVLSAVSSSPELSRTDFVRAKNLGFGDRQLAKLMSTSELDVRRLRLSYGLRPCVKQIDTVAAEFPAFTNYLYLTYAAPDSAANDVSFSEHGVIVLGSGAYRIGSSVEFDWCAVSAIRTLKSLGYSSIMINYNPETVSTDYDECDRLYFEELSVERVIDIYQLETAQGVIVSMGGQIPNNLAMNLSRQQVNILGTSPDMIDGAENRYKFSRMCDRINVDQPKWKELSSVDDAKAFCASVGYPVLVRPSYVLSGAAMNVAHKADDLEAYLTEAASVSKDCPVVISKFILEAKEIEVDAVASKGELVMHVISEHVENAGVHSGDATMVLPPVDLDKITVDKVEKATRMVANALNVTGPMNIQFIAKDNEIKVIECNLRAARSFPFVSKTVGVDLARMATKVILGKKVVPYPVDVSSIPHIGVKVAQFSFTRLLGADPILGVEMASTGEVACYGANREEAYLKALTATGQNMNLKTICVSIGAYKDKLEFLSSAKMLRSMGLTVYATPGTSDFLIEHGVQAEVAMYPVPNEYMDDSQQNILELLRKGSIDLLVNIPSNNKERRIASFTSKGYLTRRASVDFGVPLITNIKLAKLLVKALKLARKTSALPLRPFDARFSSRVIVMPGLVGLGAYDTATLDWNAATSAALKGGLTVISGVHKCNTSIGVEQDLENVHAKAAGKINCDYTIYLQAKEDNAAMLAPGAESCQGLYIETSPKEASVMPWLSHFMAWPVNAPILVRASAQALTSLLFGAMLHKRKLHIHEVRTGEDIQVIKMSKEKGLAVTCDVNVLDLYSKPTSERMIPSDKEALWENLDVIDAIVGPPMLVLPLLLHSESEGRVSMDWVRSRLVDNPRRILGLSEVRDTYIEVDMSASWEVPAASDLSGVNCRGKVRRVVLRGDIVYLDGKVWTPAHVPRNERGTLMEDGKEGGIMPSLPASQIMPATLEPRKTKRVPSLSSLRVPVLDQEVLTSSPTAKTEMSPLADDPRKAVLTRGSLLPPAPASPVNKLLREPAESQSVSWFGRHVLTVKQFSRDELHMIFNLAYEMRQMVSRMGQYNILSGKILANLFYEPSTRTSCSFEAAMNRLGGQTMTVREMSSTSAAKGETLEDTVRTMETYADVIVLRHPDAGAVKAASQYLQKPLINAGDGVGEHPTQALLDVFTIREELGTVNGITVAFVGDLSNGRTVHSLARVLSNYNVKLRYVAPETLRMPSDVLDEVASRGVEQTEHTDLDDVIRDCDVLYVTRVQKERFDDLQMYEKLKHKYMITPRTMTKLKETAIVMHPLPRVGEISPDCDSDPRAVYFRQMEYGLYIRMALLAMVLGRN